MASESSGFNLNDNVNDSSHLHEGGATQPLFSKEETDTQKQVEKGIEPQNTSVQANNSSRPAGGDGEDNHDWADINNQENDLSNLHEGGTTQPVFSKEETDTQKQVEKGIEPQNTSVQANNSSRPAGGGGEENHDWADINDPENNWSDLHQDGPQKLLAPQEESVSPGTSILPRTSVPETSFPPASVSSTSSEPFSLSETLSDIVKDPAADDFMDDDPIIFDVD